MSNSQNAQAATIHGGHAESATLASWFAQFDYSRVVVDQTDEPEGGIDVMQVISTVTSNAARVYINYHYGVVTAEIVDRYTNAPKVRGQAMHNTVMLELFLRKHKVIVDQQLRKLEDASNEQLLIAAKSEGFDEGKGVNHRASAAYWNSCDDPEKMSPADRTAIILQLREMGFQSLDITNRNWIVPCTKNPDDVLVTEASWLNGMKKPRVRKYA